jgi:DNA-directed RNA polymerase specialized sigma24 family protein
LTSFVTSTYVDGMADTTQVASAANSRDPAVGLKAVRALRALVERLEALQVDNARDQGWTWEQIAQLLGVTRQAVHKKYAGGRGPLRRKD